MHTYMHMLTTFDQACTQYLSLFVSDQKYNTFNARSFYVLFIFDDGVSENLTCISLSSQIFLW